MKTHLQRWGPLWVAGFVALLAVSSTVWMRVAVVRHHDELAEVHSEHLWSQRTQEADLDALLEELRPLGVRSLTRFDPSGTRLVTAGTPLLPDARGRARPERIGQGLMRVEHPGEGGPVVVEFHPLLANDLDGRSRVGVMLAMITSLALVLFVGLWIRHGLRLEEATKAEEKNRQLAQLGTLSAVIAHELRNPLTILLGHAQLLREDLPDNRSVAHIEAGAIRLDDLLASLLLFARTGELTREPTAVRDLVEQAAVEAGLPASVVTGTEQSWDLDPLRMRQVFVNLFTNALAACPDGTISATLAFEADALIIEVQDEGQGIPQGMHEQIFEPFHTTRTRGTGLGLAVARDIVRKHGGTLTAHEGVGTGALFRIRIPR